MYSENLKKWLLSGSEEANEVVKILDDLESRIWGAGYDFDQINAKAGNDAFLDLQTMSQVKIFALHAADRVRGFK